MTAAAAAAVVAGAAAAAVAGGHTAAAHVAAAAEQDQQDDDPQTVVAAETVVVIHKNTSGLGIWSGFTAHSMLFRRPDLVTAWETREPSGISEFPIRLRSAKPAAAYCCRLRRSPTSVKNRFRRADF